MKHLIFLIPFFFIFGCSPKITNVDRGNKDQELYIGIGAEPAGLDPHLVSGVTEHYVLLSLFEGLTTYNPKTLKIEPGVASSWDISDDKLSYTFHIDPNAKWSNGDSIKSEDFIFSYQRILSPKLGAPYAYMLYCIKGAESFHKGKTKDFNNVGLKSIDDKTLLIELHSVTPYFLSLHTHFTWWPVHPPTILKYGKITDRISKWTKPSNIVSNGPFKLSSWKLNHSIKVEKNNYYRKSIEVKLEGIHFLPINLETEELAFRNNQLHITSGIPQSRIEWYKKYKPNNIRFDPYLGVYYYLINTNHEILSDKKIRQSLAYSINRSDLTNFILKGGQNPAYHFTPPNLGEYQVKNLFSYNPDKARLLLEEAGYKDGKDFPEIEILYNTSDSHKLIAEAIQQMWKKELGIKVNLHNQEWKVYLDSRQKGNFQIARAAWIGDYLDPFTFLNLGMSSSGNNHSNWKNTYYDKLLNESTKISDKTLRLEKLLNAEKILIDEMPFIPIYFYKRSLLINESVNGWDSNILDYHPYQYIWLSN